MMKKNLETRINKIMKSITLTGILASGIYLTNCAAPSASMPTALITEQGKKPIANVPGCCEYLSCTFKGYDSCKITGETFVSGMFVNNCECYDYITSSSSSSGSYSSGNSGLSRVDHDFGTTKSDLKSSGHYEKTSESCPHGKEKK